MRTAIIRGFDRDGVAFTHDGRYLVAQPDRSRYEGKCVCFYETVTGRLAHAFVASPQLNFERVEDFAISPDGRRLAAVDSRTSDVVWWDIPESLAAARQIKTTTASPSDPPAGEGIIAAAQVVEALRKWKYATASLDRIFFARKNESFLTFPYRRHIMRIWDGESSQFMDRMLPKEMEHGPLSMSIDGKTWLVPSRSGKGVEFWTAPGPRKIAEFPLPRSPFDPGRGHRLARDGSFALIAPKEGGLLHLVPEKNHQQTRRFLTHIKRISALAIDHAGETAAVYNGQDLLLVSLQDFERVMKLSVAGIHGLRMLEFTPDGKRLVAVGHDAVSVWSTETGEQLLTVEEDEIGRSLAVSLDGKQFAAFAEDRDGPFVAVWDLASRNLVARLLGLQYSPRQLHFTDDGRNLQADANGEYYVWNLP